MFFRFRVSSLKTVFRLVGSRVLIPGEGGVSGLFGFRVQRFRVSGAWVQLRCLWGS